MKLCLKGKVRGHDGLILCMWFEFSSFFAEYYAGIEICSRYLNVIIASLFLPYPLSGSWKKNPLHMSNVILKRHCSFKWWWLHYDFHLGSEKRPWDKKRQSQGGADTNVGGVGVRTSFGKKRGGRNRWRETYTSRITNSLREEKDVEGEGCAGVSR